MTLKERVEWSPRGGGKREVEEDNCHPKLKEFSNEIEIRRLKAQTML